MNDLFLKTKYGIHKRKLYLEEVLHIVDLVVEELVHKLHRVLLALVSKQKTDPLKTGIDRDNERDGVRK